MGLSGYMYLLSQTDYILERIDNEKVEYYYCRIFGSTKRTAVYKGELKDGKLIFIQESVIYEIPLFELEGLERKTVNF